MNYKGNSMKNNLNIKKVMEGIREDIPNMKLFEQDPSEHPSVVGNIPEEAPITNEDLPAGGINTIKKEEPVDPITKEEIQKPDKEYLGSKGSDTHYYLVRVKGEGDESGIVDLQVLDASGALKYSAKENNLTVEDELTFVKSALETIKDIDTVSMAIVNEFDLLGLQKDEEAEAKKRAEAAGIGQKSVPQEEGPIQQDQTKIEQQPKEVADEA